MKPLKDCCVAEFVGTCMLIFFGCGAVHVAVLTGALIGLWQVAIVWGAGVTLAIYVAAGISGAHLNPAITVGLATWNQFSWTRVLPYVVSQVAGAFTAAALLFAIFAPWVGLKEAQKQVIRGQAGSEITAMCYCEYFPNPGPMASGEGVYSSAAHQEFNQRTTETFACLAEVLGTMFLALVVAAVTEPRNEDGPRFLAPAFIGLTVAALISVIAPLTQACFNPARDFGPRLFAYLAGWRSIAIPGPRGPTGFATVYLIAPTVGAVIGIGLYRLLIRPALANRGEAPQPFSHDDAGGPSLPRTTPS